LSGTVLDPNGAVVPAASITVTELATGVQRSAPTNEQGFFIISLLKPSTYLLQVEHPGFMTAEVKDVVLNVGDQRALRIQMKVGNVSETVNVTGEAPLIDESASVATIVDRQVINNIPLNGRTLQPLITLAPGVVLTGGTGQFSVNGQRSNANYFMVDGVGANADISTDRFPSQSLTGSAPSLTATGTTQNLVSVDALQEFNIQTSTYAPEFGRTPGGQVSVVTRSGTNSFHGALFEYFRNDVFDAKDWFANSRGLPKPPLRMSDFGGVFGGPLYLPRFGEGGPAFHSGKDRTFFFFSYEGLRLRLPQAVIVPVPTQTTRQTAAVALRPLLSAFPLPNGRDLGNGTAEFNAVYSDPSSIDAYGIRIDHKLTDKVSIFGRYSDTPSDSQTRAIPVVATNSVLSKTFTLGTTWIVSSTISNDLRFNYTRSSGATTRVLSTFGGAQSLDTSTLLPSFATLNDSIFAANFPGYRFQIGTIVNNLQRQINLVDNFSVVQGGHQLKFGVDYRRLYPFFNPLQFGLTAIFSTAARVQSGTAQYTRAAQDAFVLYFNNFSLYGQDTWKINKRTTLTYGLRWELVPPPHGAKGNEPVTISNFSNLNALSFDPRGTPLWKTRHNNFAPRVGISYALSQKPGRETVLRGGFGTFYDLGTGTVFGTAARNPFFRNAPSVTTTYPLAPSLAVRPPLSLTGAGVLAFTDVTVFDQQLELPYTLQWNASMEQSLGTSQTITLSYVGARGSRLLRDAFIPNTNFGTLNITGNTANSDYRSLQVQFNRRLSRGLQVLSSYTWSKSLDTASSDATLLLPGTLVSGDQDRGPSSFDARHIFSGAVTYDIPSFSEQRVVRSILAGC
jgi:hypothetical protein